MAGPPSGFDDDKPGETRWAHPTIVAPMSDYDADTRVGPPPPPLAAEDRSSSSWDDFVHMRGEYLRVALAVAGTALAVMFAVCGMVLWVASQ